jgi:DNA-binding MarR family transcriptional regulator
MGTSQATGSGAAVAEVERAVDSTAAGAAGRVAARRGEDPTCAVDSEAAADLGCAAGAGGAEDPEGAPDPETAADPERAAALLALGTAFRGVFAALRRLRGRDTHLPGIELSHAQCELLFELDERGELSVGELATAAQLTPATVTQMLEHLADHGHVKRSRLESDRRVVVSRLTPSGHRELERKRQLGRRRWEQALADVDPAELRAATRVLTRLQAVFQDPTSCAE